MNRRSFFSNALGRSQTPFEKAVAPRPLNVTAGLEPYTQPLDRMTALHLLRRTSFMPALGELPFVIGQTAQNVVAALLFEGKSESEITTPRAPTWVLETPKQPTTPTEQQDYNKKMNDLGNWWFNSMTASTLPYTLREKMTFFWHNHFPADRQKVQIPHYIYWQNDKFRRHRLDGKKADDPRIPTPTHPFGNLKELTRAMVSDPAMLIYLDNRANQKNRPNENFAREVMELFTLGIGNYTEQDVLEAARTLTGWNIIFNRNTKEYSLASGFFPALFDTGSKTIFGKTGNFDTDTLLDLIFEKDECAKFFARKLYKFFVYEIPDETIVTQLAQLLKTNNYELKPVLKTLLTSAHFFDEAFFGAQIKSPLDIISGLVRQFNIKNIPARYSNDALRGLSLELFNPPTVEGWKGYHHWINTSTFPLRQRIAEYLMDGKDYTGKNIVTVDDRGNAIPLKVDVLTFAKSFPSKDDAKQLVSDISDFLLPAPLTEKQYDDLLGELLQGTPAYEWNIESELAESRLRMLLKAIVRLPEFQLN